ncbi:MAG: hydrogenase maturation protease [Bacillota bacterium]|nr:hydrogenase maturation protease [Bacillota bacterium]
MGNTILGDDGAGIYAVRRLAELLLARGATPAPPAAGTEPAAVTPEVTVMALPSGRQVHLAEACAGGLALVEIMLGYPHVVLIDAWPGVPPGRFTVLSLADLDRAPAPASGHQIGLPAAMRAAARMGLPLPGQVEVWAIGVQDVSLGETCMPPVQAAVEEVACRLADALTGRPGPAALGA